MLGRIDGDEHVGELDGQGIAVEEVGEVDEVLAGGGVGVGEELVVGEVEAEDVGVDDDDAARGGAGADGVGWQAV